MVNLNSIKKNKCLELIDKLNGITFLITDFKDFLNKEINNLEVDIAYFGDLKYPGVEFYGLHYNQIKKTIAYLKSNSNFEECLKLDKLNDMIKEWFYNILIVDVILSSVPKSYLLAFKFDALIFELQELYREYINLDNFKFSSIEELNILELSILKDLYEVKKKINEFKLKEQNYFGLKSDSDYVKRNKK